MYTLLRERNDFKKLALQSLLIGTAGSATEKFVEVLVKEKQIFPESFALESIIFLTIWFGLDLLVYSILRSKSFLKSFTNRAVAGRCLTTLAIAWGVAAVFFKFHSFVLEFSAMLALWFLLDFLGSTVNRRSP